MSTAVIEAVGLGKKHTRDIRLGARHALADIAAEVVPGWWRSDVLRPSEFWALDGVDLRVEEGDSVAVLGPNGAGKSTLLMVIAGLLKPDRGAVRTRGRVHAVLELGAGFDETLTGRENAGLGAVLHGIRGRAVRAVADEAMAFAALEGVADAPLRSYSAGMRARLAYAVAVSVRPEILLIDEVLAVGDLAFQRKCLDHLSQFLTDGGTLVFVSHHFFLVQSTCSRAVVLDRGRVAFDGPVVDGVAEMLGTDDLPSWKAPAIADGADLAIESISIEGPAGDARTGHPLTIDVSLSARRDVDVRWFFSIWTTHGFVCVTGAWTPLPQRVRAGEATLRCTVRQLPLLAGRYDVRLGIIEDTTNHPLLSVGFDDPAIPLRVVGSPDIFLNQQLAMGQLATVDVDWD